jgi:hypothetical protein
MKVHPAHDEYFRFTGPGRLDKAVNSLLGILEGITADTAVNEQEFAFLKQWLAAHADYARSHPFTELVPVVTQVLADGKIDEEERDDLLWLCERLRSHDYYDVATADMQRLHASLAGIAADGRISPDELRGLSKWLAEHEHLRRCWPYDEVDGIVLGVLGDRKIDDREHKALLGFFSEFLDAGHRATIGRPLLALAGTLQGVCASCPEITFEDSLFCFTGASDRLTRREFAELVDSLGARFSNRVTTDLDYLVIGSEGNPCWSYACYGRKVESCIELRRKGSQLLIVHENDFHDAVADARAV